MHNSPTCEKNSPRLFTHSPPFSTESGGFFIDRGDFKPEDVYIIGGRRYLCRKLEFSVTEKGTERLVKGYFHEAE